MKKHLLLFSAAALFLASCGGGPIKSGTLYSYDVTKSDAFENTDLSTMPDISNISVQGNYVTIKIGEKEYDYTIDKKESFEGVLSTSSDYYTYVCYVNKYQSDAPDLKRVRIHKFMTDFLVRGEGDFDYFSLISQNDDFYPYEIKGSVDIPPHFFASYDETDLPELEATKVTYIYNPDATDIDQVPSAIKDATGFVIKGTTFTLTDGTNSTTLPIFDCSDKESMSGKYYQYSFYTKATNGCPKMFFMMAENPESGSIMAFIDNEETGKELGGFTITHNDFKSWENLKRKICVCYPIEEDYEKWAKENGR